MTIKQNFFDIVRQELGKLNQLQVEGFDFILDSLANQSEITDLRQFAYILGTIWHETAFTMKPIEEYGKGKGLKYGVADPVSGQVYYGRGYVQITWRSNYERFKKILGVDLINHPELALNTEIAMKIALIGMKKGSFTGKELDDYFNETKEDWVNARRIINGTDRAQDIANYAQIFYKALV